MNEIIDWNFDAVLSEDVKFVNLKWRFFFRDCDLHGHYPSHPAHDIYFSRAHYILHQSVHSMVLCLQVADVDELRT